MVLIKDNHLVLAGTPEECVRLAKQGVGITLEFPKRGADPCEVAVQQASFHIAGRKVNAVALPPAFSLGPSFTPVAAQPMNSST